MSPRPLEGLRVLDLTRVLAGPYCTLLLADLGAEVVKVERPGTGDDAREFGPFLESGQSAYFASINRGKKSIALDLKDEQDRECFLQLVDEADVLVENYRAGAMQRLELDAPSLRARNPRLIYTALSGFGHEGLDTDRAAYDVVIQALSGLMSITGTGPGASVRVGTSISDILTGIFGAVAILAAIRDRDRTGQGSTIDLAMLDCTVAALENAISRYTTSGISPAPLGTRHPSITPFQAFATADDPIVVAAGNDALWQRLCRTIGCPELIDDSRFATNDDRTSNQALLESQLASAFHTRPASEWLQQLSDAGIPSAPIRSIAQVVDDPHLASRGLWHRMDNGQGGEFLTAGSPFRINGQMPSLASSAPALDEHRNEILDTWLASN